jgi:hypothetical protein
MADNVAITPGSGATVAADDVSGVLYQRVKISVGADGSAADAPGDSTDGLKVQAKCLANSGVDIGDVDVLSVAGTVNVSDLVQRQTLVKKTVDFTASQTSQTIWDPTSGKKFVVVQAILSFSAAGAITVFDETDDTTNRIFKINGAANGGMAWTAAIPVISATADNILEYTTGAGAAGSLTVFGYEV